MTKSSRPAALPVSDIAPFVHGSKNDEQNVAQSVARSCEEISFLIIKGHNVAHDTINTAIDLGFNFFDLPADTTNQWYPIGPTKQCGYHGMERRGLASTMNKAAPKNLRESVFLGPIKHDSRNYEAIPEASTAYAPNMIPT